MRSKNVGVFDSNFLMIFVVIFCCWIRFCYGYGTTTKSYNITTLTSTLTNVRNSSHGTPPMFVFSTASSEGNTSTTFINVGSTTSLGDDTNNSTLPPDLPTTPNGDPTGAVLYAIIAICATVIIVAICCGCICLIKMKYRFTSLRVNFYGQGGMFRRNPNNNHGTTTSTHGNDYITHEYENEKVEFDKWEIPINDLLIDKTTKLGSGAFASVYKGYLKGKNPLLENIGNIHFALEMAENRDNEVAIKMLHTHADDESRTELKKEIAFMKTLGYHPHVLSMIGCVSSIYEPLLIVEYCANGDLLTLLRRHKDYILVDPEADCPAQADFCLTIKDLLSFSWQISDGLVYLSSKNFIHRDIACRNVLITKRMVAKISDFGLCRYSQEALYTTKVGKLPIKWMAIEALKLAEFTSKSDVWSYGVLLFELFSVGDTPYPSISPSDMLDFLLQGNRLPKPELCPEELYNMMQTMWDLNPDSRPTFEIIRKNLSAFLEVSSDAYGYIQVSQDYGKFYSKMEFPLKPTENTLEVVDESEVHIMKPLTDSGILIQQINENIGKKDEKDIIGKIDNVNGETEAEDDSKTPLLQKEEEVPSTSEECKAAGEAITCPSMEQLLKDYFTAKGCDSNPKLEIAKQRLRHQLKNTIHNFEQACEERKEQEQQQQNIPAPPQYPVYQFNPNFQQRFTNPMLNPMFRQQQQIRQMQMQMMQPPIIKQQHQQPHPPPFTRPQRFQNRQRFNFRQRPPFSPPSQNSYFFPPPPSL